MIKFIKKLFSLQNYNDFEKSQNKKRELTEKSSIKADISNNLSDVSDNNNNKEKKILFSNCPTSWGIFTDEFIESMRNFTKNFDSNTNEAVYKKRLFMNYSLVLTGEINERLSKISKTKVTNTLGSSLFDSKERYITSICVDKIFEQGILPTHGVIIDDYKRYAVMLFDNPVSENYIKRIKELFIEDGFEDLIYFCTENPKNTTDNNQQIEYLEFDKHSFTFYKEKQNEKYNVYKEYAFWWQSKENENFLDSNTCLTIKKYQKISTDCNTYMLGKLGYAFGLNEDDTRVKLPDYNELYFEGPENVPIILTISQTTGIVFHFPVSYKFSRYRDNFLKLYLIFCEGIKQQILHENFTLDTEKVNMFWFNDLIFNTKNNNDISFISLVRTMKSN